MTRRCPLRLIVPLQLTLALAVQAAPPAGLRLDGTFIQINPKMLEMSPADWRKELEAIKAARMDTIVLQFTQSGQTRFFSPPPSPSASAPADPPKTDLVELTLDFADRNRMAVYLGLLNDHPWFKQWKDPAYLEQLAAASNRLIDELWQRFSQHRSLAGWYIPYETWDGPYTDEEIANIRKLFRTIGDHCAKLETQPSSSKAQKGTVPISPGSESYPDTGIAHAKPASGRNGDSPPTSSDRPRASRVRPKPVAIAPYCPGRSKPGEIEKMYTAMLIDSGVDIVMLQDGVGARGRDDDLLEIVRYFREMRDACVTAGCEFWADLECFKLVGREDKGKTFTAADADRIGWQMAIEAPFVRKMITFDFFHYMSPYRNDATKRLYADYMERYVKRDWRPTLGRGPSIATEFGYYHDRSPESVASEIRANGYSVVHWVVTAESLVDPALLAALHRERIGVWYMTFGNGTYSTKDLPPDWESWKMVLRRDLAGQSVEDGYTRLCLNHPRYRAWRKQHIAQTIRRLPFDGVEIAEPHWPEYPGIESPAYACFCPQCLAGFRRMFPEEKALPDILREDSPLGPKKNPELWKKWLTFRQKSVTDFLNDLVNGKGGLRETVPHAKIGVWSLVLRDGVQRVREDNGEDAEEIARIVRPDLYTLQTNWPDWLVADLQPDYVKGYQPFIEQIRKADPKMPILIQADTGSNKDNRRSWSWIEDFERASWKLGATSTTFYEYFIGLYMYTDPPKVTEVRREGRQVALIFNKRLDPASAGDPTHYELDEGKVTGVKVDGNRVLLAISDARSGRRYTLKVKEISDTADRRLIGNQPRTIQDLQTVRFRY